MSTPGDPPQASPVRAGSPENGQTPEELRDEIQRLRVRVAELEGSEAALRDREAHLRLLLEQIPAIVWTTDRQLTTTSSLGAGLVKVNAHDRESRRRSAWDTFGPDPHHPVIEAHLRALGGESIQFEVDWGGRHWQSYLEPLRSSGGEIIGAVGVGLDVTDRHQAEEALRASEERFRLIAELSSDYAYTAVVETDDAIRVTSVTEGFTRITGYTLAEVEARGGWASFMHPDDRAGVAQRTQEILAGGRPVGEVRFVTKSGEMRWLRYSVRPTWNAERGRVVGFVGAVQDVTAHKRAEEGLRESEQRFRELAETIEEVFWVCDAQPVRTVYVSPAYEWVWGRSCHSLYEAPLSWLDAIHPEDQDRARAALARLLGGDESQVEYRVVRPDGSVRWIWDRAYPVRDGAGRVVRTLGVAQDITERKQAEVRLQALSARLVGVQEEERRQIAYELHDEVGQLLTAIRLSLDKLRLLVPDGDARHHVDEGQAAVDKAVTHVRDLALALRPSLLDHLGLEAAVRWLAGVMGERAGCAVRVTGHNLEGRLPPEVETAAYRIVQEALTNAVRHSRAELVWVVLTRAEAELQLVIGDNGRGFDVPAARQAALSGRSMGLLGLEERAHLLGGHTEIQSTPDQGTTISARLPLPGQAT